MQEKLVSLFLEGLLNKNLHANLYGRKHKTLNECVHDAIDHDDNCIIYGVDKPISGHETSSSKIVSESEKNKGAKAKAMVEMIMKRMNQVFRPTQRMYRCELCGGDHPTSQCLPKQNPQAPRVPRTEKWCEYEQKWTNHESLECFHRIKHVREQGYAQPNTEAPPIQNYVPRAANQNYAAQGKERAQSVLGNQPPLPGAAAVRLIQIEELGHEGALVPVSHYGEETYANDPNQFPPTMEIMDQEGMMPDGSYQMDHKTLIFIANQGARPQGGGQQIRPYRPNQGPPPGTCYNCGGDHWVRDCPNPKTERPTFNGVPPLIRTCADCGIKHFVQDCPMKPENKGKVTLNYVEVMPITSSPGLSKIEVVVPIQVITRAQAKEKIKEQKENETGHTPSITSTKTRETWKARKARRAASKAKRNNNEL